MFAAPAPFSCTPYVWALLKFWINGHKSLERVLFIPTTCRFSHNPRFRERRHPRPKIHTVCVEIISDRYSKLHGASLCQEHSVKTLGYMQKETSHGGQILVFFHQLYKFCIFPSAL